MLPPVFPSLVNIDFRTLPNHLLFESNLEGESMFAGSVVRQPDVQGLVILRPLELGLRA